LSDAFEPQRSQDAEDTVVEYFSRAEQACKNGDAVGGMHLYLAAFGFATARSRVPNEKAITSLKRAWSIACNLRERPLAEYVFEKMVPYLSAAEESHCASELQSLALDKLAELGLTRERLSQFASMATGGEAVVGPMKLMHLGNFRMPSFPDDLSSIDGIEELDQLLDEVAKESAGETPESGAPETPAEASPADETLVDEGPTVTDGTVAEKPADEVLDDLPIFSQVATLDDLFPSISKGMASKPKDSVDEYFSEPSLQEKFEEAFNDVRGLVDAEEAETGEGPGMGTREESEAGPDEGSAPGSEVFNPQGSFEITDEGISLGPGFGLRLPSEEADEEASQFGQMVDSLNEMMANFEKNNGQRVVEPAASNGGSSSTRPRTGIVAPGELPEGATFADLVGYDRAIEIMRTFGIGLRGDPDFLSLIEALNELHGIDNMPATDTLLMRSVAREDANKFMEATANELGLPTVRMSMDETIQGALTLCLTMRADNPPKMDKSRTQFIEPTVLCLEDVDLWMAPMDFMGDDATPWPQRLTRGAQEALRLIRSAVENPEVYVLATMSSFGEMDGFFCDVLTPFSIVEIEAPDDSEREEIWKSLMRSHPSLSNLRMRSLVEYSANLPRDDIYIAVREAIEEAYKQSLATRTYMPVTYDNLLEKLSAYQPLESEEYKHLEDEVAERLRSELDTFDSVDSLLGLGSDDGGDCEGDGDLPTLSSDEDFGLDNPYFAL
jgi:hypothetical protein